ncbi:TPA: hypothetical protein ACYS2D_001814 [Staphylococcus aureus]|uniref:Uncharacterized protein n=1 Tax=Staphylococcus aureus TaxID=1280 RepID=A0A6C0NCM4_STAAU|nr:hypothetical protein [Staphylococcus aureus]MCG2362644.1 hypothetical protein [Staphylococcus epidermidis]MBW8217120.1 hypothetical protein [Staphylococcus aureus]MBW8238078.1 hypothetical protein [Staphylococcus aureus]MBY0867983.1 hypothetical protein [Staphylococcus aureus]MDE3338349.1 hypothetical protein [Staphylococcus aureus]
MSRLEWPKPPEERSYDEGRFAGWDNNGRPIYKETQAGCIINALITFVVLMIIIIITAIHGDSESASILHSILDLFIGLLRIIFIPIYLILSIKLCKYGFSLSKTVFNNVLKDKFSILPSLLSYLFVAFLVYLLLKFGSFIHLLPKLI